MGDAAWLLLIGRGVSFAVGEFDEEAFAIDATAAEMGEGLDEADESLGLGEEGLGQGSGVERGEDLADAEGGDLLGGLVEFGVVVLAEEVEEQLDLGVGIFAALLFSQPDGIAGFFPTGEVGSI